VIINGYKPLNDWYALLAICMVMIFFGYLGTQVLDPLPRNIQEIRTELMNCFRETKEICSLVVMPNSSHTEVYLLYSTYVK